MSGCRPALIMHLNLFFFLAYFKCFLLSLKEILLCLYFVLFLMQRLPEGTLQTSHGLDESVAKVDKTIRERNDEDGVQQVVQFA